MITMGDSVGVQIAQGLDEAAGTKPQSNNRTTLKCEWGDHPAIVLNDLGNGNALATYRLLGMLGKVGKGKWRPNQPWKFGYGGWLQEDIDNLLNHSSNVDRFDAMIFRIPHGWMRLEDITQEKSKKQWLLLMICSASAQSSSLRFPSQTTSSLLLTTKRCWTEMV